MAGLILRTVITCPGCGFRTTEQMPSSGKQMHYQCPACGQTAKLADDDCCVFCAFARHPCPEKQQLAASHNAADHDKAP